MRRGIISPLVIDQHNTILAGHRRWRAACALTLDSVPVIVREIGDPLEAERIIIESNRQRKKTASEVMRESEQIERIIAAEAKARQKRKPEDSVRPTLDEQTPMRTDEAVAEAVGMKRSTYAKTKKVYDTAHDEAAQRSSLADFIATFEDLDAG